MPNWCENRISISGNAKDVERVFESVGCKFVNGKIVAEKEITMRSFFPMPQTFMDFDTTNRKLRKEEFESIEDYNKYSDGYDNAVKYQKEVYGCVGWYDYNLKTLGVKWDANFEGICSCRSGEILCVSFDMDTAWDAPIEWVREMSRKFKDVKIELHGEEYQNCFGRHILCLNGEDLEFENFDIELDEVEDLEFDEDLE